MLRHDVIVRAGQGQGAYPFHAECQEMVNAGEAVWRDAASEPRAWECPCGRDEAKPGGPTPVRTLVSLMQPKCLHCRWARVAGRGAAGGMTDRVERPHWEVGFGAHANAPALPKQPGPGNGGLSSDATQTLLTAAQVARLLARHDERQVVSRLPARPRSRPLPAREAQTAHTDVVSRLRILPRQARPLLRRPRARRPRTAGRDRRLEEFLDVPVGRERGPHLQQEPLDPAGLLPVPRPARQACTATRRSRSSARRRAVYRTTFTPDDRNAILASKPDLRDRIALRLLLDYGLRKGALQRRPVQALRPPPQAADGLHEGRQDPRRCRSRTRTSGSTSSG